MGKAEACAVGNVPHWYAGPDVGGMPARVGHIVFLRGDKRPRWIVEWQPHNGHVFVLVDADGAIATARPDELTRDFRAAVAQPER